MNGALISRRYVRPLFDISREQGIVGQVGDDLAEFDSLLTGSEQFRGFILDPTIGKKEKIGVVDKLFGGFNVPTRNFLRVVIEKNRTAILPEAYGLYRQFQRGESGIESALVETAVPLEESVRENIRGKLEKMFGKKLVVEHRVTPEIIGGIRVQIGNLLIDKSIKGELDNLRTLMVGE